METIWELKGAVVAEHRSEEVGVWCVDFLHANVKESRGKFFHLRRLQRKVLVVDLS